VLLVLLVLLYGVVVLRTAWLSDDAYITFRTIENFVHGYGLGYNPYVRVQAYTHPLWMLLLSGVYFVTNQVLGLGFWGELYYVTVSLSMLLSILAIILFSVRICRSSLGALVGVVILTLSRAFVDYSTSGLENPLSHLLLVAFFLVYLMDQREPAAGAAKRLQHLSLIAALLATCRVDLVLLVLPVLVVEFLRVENKRKAVGALFIGFAPLIAWELFSVFYYGFPFPNTAYAKLNTGIGAGELFQQGVYYAFNSLDTDPITLFVIAGALAIPLAVREPVRWRGWPIGLGIVLYLAYVTCIGGDFMSGRFYTGPLFLSVILLADSELHWQKAVMPMLAIIVGIGLSAAHPTLLSDATYGAEGSASCEPTRMDNKGVADERCYYYPITGLLTLSRSHAMPDSAYRQRNWVFGHQPSEVRVDTAIGFLGYQLGPDIHVVDVFALADPLLARLPARQDREWRIGHFERAIPEGYLATLAAGWWQQSQIQDPSLAAYYEKLALVTRGSLLDWHRLVEIWNLNTGRYDYLIERYWAAN
jgi:arabinofuranosyltransferase